MSNKQRSRQYADAKGAIAEGFDGNIIEAEGASVPADATAGFAPGCRFTKRAGAAGAQVYINEGSATSCSFKALPPVAFLINGLAAGYKIARGQLTTASASDTVVTGLATVVSVVASLEADPVDDPFMVSAQIGDQAGSPAAGSIIIKTWKNTGGTDPTPAAATTFSKKVNWVAIGT